MKLDVRAYPGGVMSPGGLLLHDRETGEMLPLQRGGNLFYGVDDNPRLQVEFIVDGDDVRMGDNTDRHLMAMQAEEAKVQEANDLQQAHRAWAGLSEDNRRRFCTAHGLRPLGEGFDMQDPVLTLKALNRQAEKLTNAIKWALGEVGDFPLQRKGEGRYWWRRGLRERAFGREA